VGSFLILIWATKSCIQISHSDRPAPTRCRSLGAPPQENNICRSTAPRHVAQLCTGTSFGGAPKLAKTNENGPSVFYFISSLSLSLTCLCLRRQIHHSPSGCVSTSHTRTRRSSFLFAPFPARPDWPSEKCLKRSPFGKFFIAPNGKSINNLRHCNNPPGQGHPAHCPLTRRTSKRGQSARRPRPPCRKATFWGRGAPAATLNDLIGGW